MATEFGGAGALAQTVLALNLAYIALDRFRYRAEIQRLSDEAVSTIKKYPWHFHGDRAFSNVRDIPKGNDPASWTKGQTGFYSYKFLFQKPWDIGISVFSSLIAVAVIILQAYIGLLDDENGAIAIFRRSYISAESINRVIFILLVIGVLTPVIFVLAGWYSVLAGWYSVQCAANSIHDNVA